MDTLKRPPRSGRPLLFPSFQGDPFPALSTLARIVFYRVRWIILQHGINSQHLYSIGNGSPSNFKGPSAIHNQLCASGSTTTLTFVP